MNDLNLYLEEQRQLSLELKRSIDTLIEYVASANEQYVAPKEQVTVSGKVEVNTEKEVTVSNLEAISEALDKQTQKLAQHIDNSVREPHKQVEVTNLSDTLTVKNLSELKAYFDEIVQALEAKDMIVNVEKQTLELPTSPTKPLAVRLSDGKKFYNAVFSFSQAAQSFNNDPFRGYYPADEAASDSYKYYGFTRHDGYWYIMREDTVNKRYRYAVGAPQQSGGGLYADAWTNRANLTYRYFHEVRNA